MTERSNTMQKTTKRQTLEQIAKRASNDYLAGYLNGLKAAKDKETKKPQTDKKPA